MTVSLKGAVALVTGAAGGVGSALAMEAVRRGAKVMVADVVSGEEVVARLREAGGEAEWTATDVTDYDDVAKAIALTVEKFGGLNVLCNNVGRGAGGGLDAADPARARQILDSNVLGYFNPIHASIGLLRAAAAAGGPAYILNTGSEHSLGVPPHIAPMSVYTTSKFGVLGLTEAARRDFGPDGIGVSMLAPSYVLTPMIRRYMDADPNFAAAVKPYGQEPELVARMAFDGLLAGTEIIVTAEVTRQFALERARRLVEQFGG